MFVRLLDANQRIYPATVAVLGLADSKTNRLALIMTMPNHPAFVINHIPTIQVFVPVNMECSIRAFIARLHHVSDREVRG
jgi:hypothetical protein